MKKILSWIKLKFLNLFQDRLIFKPFPSNVAAMKEPHEYGLRKVTAEDIKTEDGISIHLWTKEPEKDNPVFVVFHGNTGHFGDVGTPKPDENYDPEYRIKLLAEITSRGCGLVAVSCRGYGKSTKAAPNEEGFILDVRAVAKYVLDEKKYPPGKIIILGESLGSAVAMIMAEVMTAAGKPPAIVATIASFSSMKAKVMELHPDLLEDDIERNVRHKFDSERRMKMLNDETHLYIAHPAEDMVTGKGHSKKLADIAKKHGLKVTYTELAEAGHITWDAKEVVSGALEAYQMHGKTMDEISK